MDKSTICYELEDKISDIQYAIDELYQLKRDIEKQEIKNKNNSIHDINNFKRELDMAGLLTKEMEQFLTSYIQYDNPILD